MRGVLKAKGVSGWDVGLALIKIFFFFVNILKTDILSTVYFWVILNEVLGTNIFKGPDKCRFFSPVFHTTFTKKKKILIKVNPTSQPLTPFAFNTPLTKGFTGLIIFYHI